MTSGGGTMPSGGKRKTLMTLRVSRDGGRTWGPLREINSTEPLLPVSWPEYPPCACPRCRPSAGEGRKCPACGGVQQVHIYGADGGAFPCPVCPEAAAD